MDLPAPLSLPICRVLGMRWNVRGSAKGSLTVNWRNKMFQCGEAQKSRQPGSERSGRISMIIQQGSLRVVDYQLELHDMGQDGSRPADDQQWFQYTFPTT